MCPLKSLTFNIYNSYELLLNLRMIYVKFGWDWLKDSGEFFNFFFICFNLQKTLSGYNIYIVYFRQYLTKTIQAKSDKVNRNLALRHALYQVWSNLVNKALEKYFISYNLKMYHSTYCFNIMSNFLTPLFFAYFWIPFYQDMLSTRFVFCIMRHDFDQPDDVF